MQRDNELKNMKTIKKNILENDLIILDFSQQNLSLQMILNSVECTL